MNPPKEFLEWLDAQYGWIESNLWRANYTYSGNLEQNEQYLFWKQTILPVRKEIMGAISNPAADEKFIEDTLGKAIAGKYIGQREAEVLREQAIQKIKTDKAVQKVEQEQQEYGNAIGAYQLGGIIDREFRAGNITQKQGDALYNDYLPMAEANLKAIVDRPGIGDTLTDYTSPSDLASKINLLPLREVEKLAIYNSIKGATTPEQFALRAAEGRQLQEQKELGMQRGARTVVSGTKAAQALMRADRDPNISPFELDKALAQAGITRETGIVEGQPFMAYSEGETHIIKQIVNRLELESAQRGKREGDIADRLIERLSRPAAREEFDTSRPEIPEALPIAEAYLKGTTLGEGTNLRDFIESGIKEIYGETQQARMDWWRRMNPTQAEQEAAQREAEAGSYEGERSQLQAAINKWGATARTAPSSEYAGGTYYGPGGLKAIAEQAWSQAQARLSGLRPEDYPSAGMPAQRPQEEDPFLVALRARSPKMWREQYYRKPGTGLVPSLTPSVRY